MIRWEDKSRHTPRGRLADAPPPRTIDQAKADMKRPAPCRLEQVGMPGSKHWRCSCGKWKKDLPDVGPYGNTTMKARIAQLQMAHRKHQSCGGKSPFIAKS